MVVNGTWPCSASHNNLENSNWSLLSVMSVNGSLDISVAGATLKSLGIDI